MFKKLTVVIIAIVLIAVSFYLYRNGKGSITGSPTLSVSKPSSSISTINKIKGGDMPFNLTVADGFEIHVFANNIPSARDLFFTPQGTLLVSSPSTGSVYALPDKDNDGIADNVVTVLSGLSNAHGLEMYKGKLFVAGTTQVDRYSYNEETMKATFDKKLFSLPSNIDHNKRTLLFDKAGNLYTSVGSTCNVCEEKDEKDATVMISDADGNNLRVYAKGLRNAPFMATDPGTGKIWVTEMGRDLLGDNVPHDEINILQDKGNYGWPYCYEDKTYDSNFNKNSASYCNNTLSPTYQIQAHSAPLGLAFIPSSFSQEFSNDLLVSYHGSWNRSVKTGYKVVRMDTSGNSVTGMQDFVTGFLQNNTVLARPVDITFDRDGYAYISDDKSGYIFIVSKK